MAKFTFRLAALLRLRESRRDECRAALAEAYRVDEVLARQFDSLVRELDALRTFCRLKASPGAVDIDRLVEAQRYELVARAQQRESPSSGRRWPPRSSRRQTLVEADREVRVLDKLRERQAEQHRREEELQEAKRLDEVATQQHFRQALAAPPGSDDGHDVGHHVPSARPERLVPVAVGGNAAWGPAEAGTTSEENMP